MSPTAIGTCKSEPGEGRWPVFETRSIVCFSWRWPDPTHGYVLFPSPVEQRIDLPRHCGVVRFVNYKSAQDAWAGELIGIDWRKKVGDIESWFLTPLNLTSNPGDYARGQCESHAIRQKRAAWLQIFSLISEECSEPRTVSRQRPHTFQKTL